MPTYTFAERLEELKQIRGLTNSDLARICKIDKSNITRYCQGKYKAKQDVIYKMAQNLGIDEAWLMGYDVPMYKENQLVGGKLDDNSMQLLEAFKSLSKEQQRMIIAQLQGLTQFQKDQDD